MKHTASVKAYIAWLGKKGGHARAATLSPARRVEIAKAAAFARWGKKKPVVKRKSSYFDPARGSSNKTDVS